ncbi:MAG: 7,8-didemethyl-8-hydroxy-5-deazariboflavin synthase CofG [Bryobacteraceae bacterium]|nr:7,8-didemethyl-8-hydroxy-5-deazariboflavin synthase CofG [Bryobacteraceae bacterium]
MPGRSVATGRRASPGISADEARAAIRARGEELLELFQRASRIRARRTGTAITYSRKVFLPLTNLCRDRCKYCTFVRRPGDPLARTMTPDEVLRVARAGRAAGCKEALFSLGDKPELVYPDYRDWLREQGFGSTVEYLTAMCRLVFEETGLLPHSNPGVLTREEMLALRPVNISLGMMLETTSRRLLEPGQAHHRCPDKVPEVRLAALETAGELGIPFTTGILIGIGETLDERVDALCAIRDLHARHGHIQEAIVQNFRAKPDTEFRDASEPGALDIARTAAVARLIFGEEIHLQVPPNLTPDAYGFFLLAGINDWGGISPVTRDFINPEMAWPKVELLRSITADAGFEPRERLAAYPEFVLNPAWIPDPLRRAALRWTDDSGMVGRDKEAA